MAREHGSGNFVIIRDFVDPGAVPGGPWAKGSRGENPKPPPTVGLHAGEEGDKERIIIFFPTVRGQN